MHVAVIGGGVSGLRAALTLARAGVRVTLLEKNQHLGGRVFSFQTPDFGEIDIGQHIWLKACTALEEFLRDLEVPEDWVFRQERLAMTYRWPDGETRHLSSGGLPGSLGFLPILRGSRLSAFDKLRLARGLLRARFCSAQRLDALDDVSFADWLVAHGQSPAVIQWFWAPLVVGVCNGRLEEVSARYGLFTIRESLLKSPQLAAICLLRRPLSEVFDRHARQVLTKAGVEIQTGAMVREVLAGTPVVVRSRDHQARPFDQVILALPLKRIRDVLPRVELPPSPEDGAIAGLLLRFARPVMEELFFCAVGSPVQFVFNKSAVLGRQEADGSQALELVLSAAEREIRLGVERVAAELLPELAKLVPRIRETRLLAKRLLIHGTATFRVTPGEEGRRLPAIWRGLPNVLFAGDYAATGWPSTMESGVRAGQAAALQIAQPQA